MQFKTHNRPHSNHWTPHCGIIILNKKFSLNILQDGIDNGRFILADIHHASTAATTEADSTSFSPTSPPITTILNIYGRSHLHSDRAAFYTSLLEIPVIFNTLHQETSPVLIMGDFNYSYEQHQRADGSLTSAPEAWVSLLASQFVDCFQDQKQPTWKSTVSSSIIDFIFCSSNDYHRIHDAEQRFLSTSWTDHAMLGISFQYQDIERRGPGAWKANPFLARRKDYRSALAGHLQSIQATYTEVHSFSTAQHTWDWVKSEVKLFTKSFQLEDNNWRRQQIRRLQKKRNRMYRQQKNRGLYFSVLETIETQIAALQESLAEIDILKAGKFWREHGEKSAGYIKRSGTSRDQQSHIAALRDPTTQELSTDPDEMQHIASPFYTQLFTPDTLDFTAIDSLLSSIPPSLRLTAEDRDILTTPIDFDDILESCKNAPRQSSPGSDGIPYEILNLVIRYPPYRPLLIKVFNDALQHAVFPDTWNESIMTLLKKKGDSTDMRNYRPLSLANCDYKYFTRLLNRRMMEVAPKLINSSQIGFVPGKYIAENGLRCQLIMEDAQLHYDIADQRDLPAPPSKDIGLLLDQEKAYDRVNLSYFRLVLHHYGFPPAIIDCIHNLMALNTIKININGYFTPEVPKLRGFKQGDPLSCICYDLAFEPFLQAILQDDDFAGYTLGPHQDSSNHPAPSVNTKLLCYADDALVFIHNRNDLRLLDYYMDLFCRASNAKFNYNKVEAFSLSGRDHWPFWQRQLEAMNIHHLHSRKDDLPLIYLGFPLIQSTTQRQNHVQSIISKLEVAVKLHSIRSLSVVGKATVVNTLILSKCWYIFRVTALTQQDIQSITSVAIRFLKNGIFPAIPWSTWTLPKRQGGLGILDVQAQYAALYFRWIQPLLTASSTTFEDIRPLSCMLIHYINNINHSRHHHVPLLLPTTRRIFLRRTRMATIDIIYKSIDLLPRNFDSVRLSHATSLQLPLHAVLYVSPHSTFRLPTKMREMRVLDVFQHNPDHHFLHWKDNSDPSLRHWKMAPKKLFNGLASGDILLQPFFQPLCLPSSAPAIGRVDSNIDFTPLAAGLTFPPGNHIFSSIPTKTFRQACAAAHVPSHLRDINGRVWKSFWSLSLTMVQRNVIYRFISNSIPHKSLLHRVFTDLHPSPLCTICSISTETSVHFLFHCPPKATVWRAIIFEFLWPTVSIQDIITAITSLDFHNIKYCQRSEVSAPIIVIITLANIWRAHFRTVFDATPFEVQPIIANIRADVNRRINEDQVHSTL